MKRTLTGLKWKKTNATADKGLVQDEPTVDKATPDPDTVSTSRRTSLVSPAAMNDEAEQFEEEEAEVAPTLQPEIAGPIKKILAERKASADIGREILDIPRLDNDTLVLPDAKKIDKSQAFLPVETDGFDFSPLWSSLIDRNNDRMPTSGYPDERWTVDSILREVASTLRMEKLLQKDLVSDEE